MGLKEQDNQLGQATSPEELERRLMDGCLAKSELEWHAKNRIEKLNEKIAELSKAHTFCNRHNEDDIDYCPNCTIEKMDDAQQQIIEALEYVSNYDFGTEPILLLRRVRKALKQGDSDGE